MKPSLQLTGIGLKAPHFNEIIEKRPGIAWFEVHSENYFGEGGKLLANLERIRKDYPISLHGVSLSLGSTDELNWHHLKKLHDLIQFIHPCLISEHLSWSSINGHYLHDLLPLPYTEEALAHIVDRIKQVQDYLNKQILIENISSYIAYHASQIPEYDFLTEVAHQSGCGILLDINNIYVSATNLSINPYTYIDHIPHDLVQEIHLGGFTTTKIKDKEVLIDSHNRPVVPAVWDLYKKAIEQMGSKPTIIEWDNDIPTFETLYLEAYRAEKMMRESSHVTKLAN